jgi:protoheme IX farnesyltransferase
VSLLLRRLSIATAVTTVVLFAAGGLVRGTGSGLGCSTWPACEPGQLFPTGTIHSLIEFSHRALAFVVVVLALAGGIVAWMQQRHRRQILVPALAAFPLVMVQAALGGVVVATDLDPSWVTAHFVTALVLIADVVWLAVAANLPERRPMIDRRAQARMLPAARFAVVAVGALLLAGTYVRASGAQLVFTDWPLMDGRLIPSFDVAGAGAMFLHRVLALVGLTSVLWAMVRARTMQPREPLFVRLSTIATVLFVAQIVSGAANVWTRLRPWAVVAHVAFSVLIWATLVALLAATRQRSSAGDLAGPDGDPAAADDASAGNAAPGPGLRDRITAYVQLTKPRIIVLLLITTVPAMMLAKGGVPSGWLIAATLIGGTLAAGAANSINMYLDRDIDQVMKRTQSRPLPAHQIRPEQALAFGFWLGAISFLFLASTVNMLAAVLSLSAIAFYVFMYTMWLKRSTTQNIVIGGAAGAAPALVGWAAVTGSLALPAWVLFAIIFVWTPPHFWALSIRVSSDYAAAGVPMLPVVKGEDETRRQILLYSLGLFLTTLVLIPVASMGPIYIAVAVVFGGLFIHRALILWRDPSQDRAWKVFTFSIWYLAALFAAVAADALVS